MISVPNIFNAATLKTDAAPRGSDGLANAFSTMLVAAGLKTPNSAALPTQPELTALPVEIPALPQQIAPAAELPEAIQAPLASDVFTQAHGSELLMANAPLQAEVATQPSTAAPLPLEAPEESAGDDDLIAQLQAAVNPQVTPAPIATLPTSEQHLGLAIMASVDMGRAQRAATAPAVPAKVAASDAIVQIVAAPEAIRSAASAAPVAMSEAAPVPVPAPVLQAVVAAIAAQPMPAKAPISVAQELAVEAAPSRQDGLLAGIGAASRSEGATAATAAPTSMTASLTDMVGTKEWTQRMGAHLVGMHMRGDQKVELSLNPAELGPLSIQMKMSDNQAHLQFFTGHGQVRQALEQAFPQLRDSLSEQGITLGNTSVNDQPRQQREDTDKGQTAAGLASVEVSAEEPQGLSKTQSTPDDSEISTYA